jgi:precorrin-6B methylase 2
MSRLRSIYWLILVLAFTAATIPAQTQPQSEYKPEVGQPGKDVVWVPTAQELVDKMLDLAKLTPQDYLIDLGSGDGRTVITAAKRGVQAMGIEYNPDMVELSKRNAAAAGVSEKAVFTKADLFESDFSKATVITMFLLPDINIRLRPKLLEMKPGTRVVSNSFTMEEWEADGITNVDGSGCTSWCTAYLWIIPAKVEGTWQLAQSQLTIKQSFQMISGSLASDGKTTPISGKLTGNQIVFKAGDVEYNGIVNGSTISGTQKTDLASSNWTATRVNQ